MPVQKSELPAYCHHKARNLAFVRLNGKAIYLGRYGSAESRAEYDRLIQQWLDGGRAMPEQAPQDDESYTVTELAADAIEYALTYYVKNGKPTDEVECLKSAIRPLVELYAELPAKDFGPKSLMAYRDHLVKAGLTRGWVNSTVGRIKRIFAWAVVQEKIPGETLYRLKALPSLRKGRSTAKDNPPVKPAPEHLVKAVLQIASKPIKAMIELQLATGARPGEITIMRACDLSEIDKPIWKYTPQYHKTEGHGIVRQIAIGPRGQEIIKPFLTTDLKHYLFSPTDADMERRQQRAAARKTPKSCGNTPGANRVAEPKKKPGERYDTRAYGHAIRDACKKAFPVPAAINGNKEKAAAWNREHNFHAHQLRHTFATRVRAEFGLDPVQSILGHAHAKTSEIYAERDFTKVAAIILKVG
jgi:integrase